MHKESIYLSFILMLALTACGGGGGGSPTNSGFTDTGRTTSVSTSSASQIASGADNQSVMSRLSSQAASSSTISSQIQSVASSLSSSAETSSSTSSPIGVINSSSSLNSSSVSSSSASLALNTSSSMNSSSSSKLSSHSSSISSKGFSSTSSASKSSSSSLSDKSSSSSTSSKSTSSSLSSKSSSSSTSSKPVSSSSSSKSASSISSSTRSSSSLSISSSKSSSSNSSTQATLLWQADFNDGIVLGVAQHGASVSVVNGAYKLSYPLATGGEQYSWLNYDPPANTKQLYISFKAKMPGNKAGLKFFKVFGRQGANGSVSNTTFALDYTGIDDGIGSLYAISFGDGEHLQNDTQNVIFLSGENPGWIGRSYGKTAQVQTPMKKAFTAASWGTEWHTFKIMVKFNDGNSAANEIANGAYYLEIDGNVYANATGLFNRHYNSGDINHIEFGGWTQGGKHGPNPAFDLYYDDIVVSSGGWVGM